MRASRLCKAINPVRAGRLLRERLLAQGASSLPKLASQTRTLREVYDRIGHLSDAERQYLSAEADRAEQQAMVWLAVCRTYRFIYEFAVEVISERSNHGGLTWVMRFLTAFSRRRPGVILASLSFQLQPVRNCVRSCFGYCVKLA